MGRKNDMYWDWRNKQIEEQDEKKRRESQRQRAKSLIMRGNAQAALNLSQDDFVRLPADPPFAEKMLRHMHAGKQKVLALIQQNPTPVAPQLRSELVSKITRVDFRWADAGDRFDHLRRQLESIIQKTENSDLKLFIGDVQLMLMDLVILHGEYMEKMQAWNRSSI